MKNLFTLIIAGMFLLVGTFVFTNKLKPQEPYIDSSLAKIQQKQANEEDFILYVYDPNCSFCKQFIPKLTALINENNLEVYGLNIAKNSNRHEDFIQEGTPLLLSIKNGKIDAKQVGDTEKEETLRFLQKNAPYLFESE